MEKTMPTLRTIAASTLLVALSAACSPAHRERSGPAPQRAEHVAVKVTNNNWADMVVYAVRSGIRHRLGTVTSMQTQLLRVPRNIVSPTGDLQLLADPIGSPEPYVSPRLMTAPGQRVEFVIQNHLAISSVSVW
jgi:hypothetical protein